MNDGPTSRDSHHFGYAPTAGVTQRLLHFDQQPDRGELRIEASVPSDATVLIVTWQSAHADETDQKVAAASAGISASPTLQDHAASRQEIDRATEADWSTSTVVIDDAPHPARVLQLLSGNWAGYVQYRSAGIALGTRGLDVRDVRLATVDPLGL